MKHKKAQAFPGMSTFATWVLIIAITITILVIMGTTTNFGNELWEKIKDTMFL